MRKNIFKFGLWGAFIFFISLSIGGAAKAENVASSASESLTEEAAIQRVMQNNYDRKSALVSIEIARQELMKAGLWPNPEAEFSLVTDRFYADQGEGSREFGLSQALPVSGRINFQKKVAKLGIERAEWQVKDFERLLIASVKKIFYEILILQEKEKVLSSLVELNEKLLEVVQSRLSHAEVSQIDLSLTNGELQVARQELFEAKALLYEKRATLNRLMGLHFNEPFVIQSGLTTVFSETLDLENLIGKALENRPDLKAKAIEEKMGEGALQLARKMRIPDITVGGFYQKEKSRFEVDGKLEMDDDKLIGFRVSLPLPLFDRKQADIAEANAEKKKASIEILDLKIQVEEEVAQAVIRDNASKEILDSYGNGVLESIEKSVQLIQDAYAQGQVSFLDVVQTQGKFKSIQIAYLGALQNHKESLIELEVAMGMDLKNEKEGKNQ